MKKSLSLLVAIAMVFSMFSAVAAAASESGTKLQGLGVIKGNQNGDLLEDANWLRQDVAVLMSRLAGKETEAKETVKSHTFTDVRGTFYDGYISWAKENNFMQGNSATNFGFDNEITYKEFATVILRALGVDTSDYSKIGELAIAAGIIDDKLNLDEKAVRGVTYDIITTALDKEVDGQKLGTKLGLPGYEVVAPAISVAPTAVKEVTVTFNKEIATDKAKFELKRGVTPVTVDKVTYSEDKKVAKLELNTKLVTGEYTVVAKDATEAELSASFSAENEKVANIEFVGDKFALGSKDDGTVESNKIEVSYKVTNQYSEDVTRTYGGSVNFQPSKGSVESKTNGKLVIALAASTNLTYQINEQVYISATYSNGTNNVFVNETLAVGTQSRVDSVTVKELYHADGKAISAGSNFTEYTLLFEAKDQYGNLVTNLTKLKNDLSVYVSNPAIFDIAKDDQNKPNILNDQGKNKDQVGLKLKESNTASQGFVQEGTNSVVFNSIFAGKQTKFDVEVSKGSAVQSISLTSPSNVAAGDKKVKVPFSAVDGNGNEVTKYDDLKNRIMLNSSVGGENKFYFDKETGGKAVLILDLTGVPQGTYSLFANVKNSNSQSTVQVSVQAAPKPNYIKKVDVDRNKILKGDAQTAEFEVKPDKIKIDDTLSREWDVDASKYDLTLTKVSGDAGFTINGLGTGDVITDSTKIVASAKGTARFKVTLKNKAGVDAVELTSEFTVAAAELKDLKDFTVNDLSKMFGGNLDGYNHSREVKVFGKYNGESYQLDKSQFVVNLSTDGLTVNADNKIVVENNGYNFGTSDVKEATVNFTVTVLNSSFDQFSKSLVVSNEKPVIKSVTTRTEKGFKGQAGLSEITVTKKADFKAGTTIDKVFQGLKFVDQYGDTVTVDPIVYISNVNEKITFNTTALSNVKASSIGVATVSEGAKFEISYNIPGHPVAQGKLTVEVE